MIEITLTYKGVTITEKREHMLSHASRRDLLESMFQVIDDCTSAKINGKVNGADIVMTVDRSGIETALNV